MSINARDAIQGDGVAPTSSGARSGAIHALAAVRHETVDPAAIIAEHVATEPVTRAAFALHT
jgi:hypothetical protein